MHARIRLTLAGVSLAVALSACSAAGSVSELETASTPSETSTASGTPTIGAPESPAAATPEPTTAPSTSEPPTAELTQTAADALAKLAALPEVPRSFSGPEYRRDAFGDSWEDVDGNGCNQRDDVLLRDAVAGSTTVQWQRSCSHDVLAGTWIDPYTWKTLVFTDLKNSTQAQAIQIDHIVPLAEAWRSGAHAWSDDRRLEFANDLDVLLAVDGPTNQSKSDDDPASWRPRAAYQCEYAIRWVEVKAKWALGVDASERSALTEMLTYCQ